MPLAVIIRWMKQSRSTTNQWTIHHSLSLKIIFVYCLCFTNIWPVFQPAFGCWLSNIRQRGRCIPEFLACWKILLSWGSAGGRRQLLICDCRNSGSWQTDFTPLWAWAACPSLLCRVWGSLWPALKSQGFRVCTWLPLALCQVLFSQNRELTTVFFH